MDIPYSTRSEFFEPIEEALREVGSRMDRPVRVLLKPGGYNRDVHIIIRPNDGLTFWADWSSKQPSRFSARVRAAATVLRRRGLSGEFRISHRNGTLVIRPD